MFLRRLNLERQEDLSIALALYEAAPEFELDSFSALPSPATSRPLAKRFPVACPPEHRLTFAAFDHERPVGLTQVALHHPSDDVAGLLLLLVPTTLRQRHIGCEMVERLSRQARRWPGIHSWGLGVLSHNTTGLAFWQHCGFRTVDTGLVLPGYTHSVISMTRPVKQRPACQHHRATESAADVSARHLFARLG